MKYYDIKKSPFRIKGLWGVEALGEYRRIPEEVAAAMPAYEKGIVSRALAKNTSGGRVLFSTDADEIRVRIEYDAAASEVLGPNFSLAGCAGLTAYSRGADGWHFAANLLPPTRERPCDLGFRTRGGMTEYMIYLPTYSTPVSVEIGLPDGALLVPAPERKTKNVVFVGNSITQGACASGAGFGYVPRACRAADVDFENYGFSGGLRGEPELAEFVATRPADMIVLDYDWNAPTPEDLEATHWNFYRILRGNDPKLPILLLTRSDVDDDPSCERRRGIIRATYERAKAMGENVYYLDGSTFYADAYPCLADRMQCTVDRCHPNDLGMYLIAQKLAPVIRAILEV